MRAPSDRRREGRATRLVAALFAMVMAAAAVPAAHADEAARVAQLSAVLGSNQSERDRVAACTALARLNDKTALRPLVSALKDASPSVRGIAAAGLGKLGHRAALPALRAAQSDSDEVVQKRAAEAIVRICDANNLAVAAAPTATVVTAKLSIVPAAASGRGNLGNPARAAVARPELYIVVKSASDDSPGKHDKKARKLHAEALRAAMASELASDALVAASADAAKKFHLDARQIDVSVVSIELRTAGAYMEVEAQLRLAISDDGGRMLSFVSGGAKIQVPRRGYDVSYLPQLRREALENAVRGLFAKLIDQCRTSMTS